MDIESDMKRYIDRAIIGFISEEDKLFLIELESRNRTILCDRERRLDKKVGLYG